MSSAVNNRMFSGDAAWIAGSGSKNAAMVTACAIKELLKRFMFCSRIASAKSRLFLLQRQHRFGAALADAAQDFRAAEVVISAVGDAFERFHLRGRARLRHHLAE